MATGDVHTVPCGPIGTVTEVVDYRAISSEAQDSNECREQAHREEEHAYGKSDNVGAEDGSGDGLHRKQYR